MDMLAFGWNVDFFANFALVVFINGGEVMCLSCANTYPFGLIFTLLAMKYVSSLYSE